MCFQIHKKSITLSQRSVAFNSNRRKLIQGYLTACTGKGHRSVRICLRDHSPETGFLSYENVCSINLRIENSIVQAAHVIVVARRRENSSISTFLIWDYFNLIVKLMLLLISFNIRCSMDSFNRRLR